MQEEKDYLAWRKPPQKEIADGPDSNSTGVSLPYIIMLSGIILTPHEV